MQFKDKRVLILSPNSWGDMHISKHHYALVLANLGNDVYFLNPPNINGPFLSLKKISNNLTIIDYSPIYRGKKYLPNFVFKFLIWLQINIIQFKISGKIDVLWSFTTSFFFHLKWFKAGFHIFHPVDQLNSKLAVNIGKESDVIFTCSEYILDELKDINRPKIVVSHGVSPFFVNFEYDYWRKNNEINVCYVGNLFIKNLDRNQLKKIIEQNTSHCFHFIGAIDPKESNISAWLTEESMDFVKFLKSARNVICHGVVPSSMIPEIIKDMDAFLVCYESNEGNVISNSHKILEYLSSGRVVISSFVQHYKNSDLIQMLDTPNSSKYINLYFEVMSNLRHHNSIEKQNQRMRFAKSNSYESNILKMESFIKKNFFNENE